MSIISSDRSRSVVFGLGNYLHPTIRSSIGLSAINHMISTLRLGVESPERLYGDITRRNRLILVRPKVPQLSLLNKNVFPTLEFFEIGPESVTLVTYSPELVVGEFETVPAGQEFSNFDRLNECLAPLIPQFERLNSAPARVYIGVSPILGMHDAILNTPMQYVHRLSRSNNKMRSLKKDFNPVNHRGRLFLHNSFNQLVERWHIEQVVQDVTNSVLSLAGDATGLTRVNSL